MILSHVNLRTVQPASTSRFWRFRSCSNASESEWKALPSTSIAIWRPGSAKSSSARVVPSRSRITKLAIQEPPARFKSCPIRCSASDLEPEAARRWRCLNLDTPLRPRPERRETMRSTSAALIQRRWSARSSTCSERARGEFTKVSASASPRTARRKPSRRGTTEGASRRSSLTLVSPDRRWCCSMAMSSGPGRFHPPRRTARGPEMTASLDTLKVISQAMCRSPVKANPRKTSALPTRCQAPEATRVRIAKSVNPASCAWARDTTPA